MNVDLNIRGMERAFASLADRLAARIGRSVRDRRQRRDDGSSRRTELDGGSREQDRQVPLARTRERSRRI